MNLANPEIDHSFKGLVVVLTSGLGTEKTVQKQGLDNNKPDAPDWTQALRQIAESGDRQAFEQVFAHFAPRVKAYMMRLGSDGASAEELTQEALAAVWRKAGQYDPVNSTQARRGRITVDRIFFSFATDQ